jgi:uncharacterized protein (TIGR02117 family)
LLSNLSLDPGRSSGSIASNAFSILAWVGWVSPSSYLQLVLGCCFRFLTGASLLLAAGCASDSAIRPSGEEVAARTLYVVRHGWHTGIAVRAGEVPRDAWPFRKDFSASEYFELGWGDRDFYQATAPGFLLALDALFLPSPGALHVVGFDGPVQRYFRAQEVVEVTISDRGFDGLVAYIHDGLELDTRGEPVVLGAGLYGKSRFYASRESFHLFRTCNVWTAQALRAAGVPVTPFGSLTAEGLLSQLRAFNDRPMTAPY